MGPAVDKGLPGACMAGEEAVSGRSAAGTWRPEVQVRDKGMPEWRCSAVWQEVLREGALSGVPGDEVPLWGWRKKRR